MTSAPEAVSTSSPKQLTDIQGRKKKTRTSRNTAELDRPLIIGYYLLRLPAEFDEPVPPAAFVAECHDSGGGYGRLRT